MDKSKPTKNLTSKRKEGKGTTNRINKHSI